LYNIFDNKRGGEMMLAVNYSTIRNNLKDYCDKVTDEFETVVVTRKDEKNVVIISLEEYNTLMKSRRNAEYLAQLEISRQQILGGDVVVKTMTELEAMSGE